MALSALSAEENGLEERAAEALRAAPRWQQRHVMDQGSLATCRNPNAGLMGRGLLHVPRLDALEVCGARKSWTRGMRPVKGLRPSRPLPQAQHQLLAASC